MKHAGKWLCAALLCQGGCSRSGYDLLPSPADATVDALVVEMGPDATQRDLSDGAADDLPRDGPPRRPDAISDLSRDADSRAADAAGTDTGSIPDAAVITTVIDVAEDTSVRQGSPDTAFGTNEELALGYCSASIHRNMRVWLKFDLGALPPGTTVVSAEVELYFYVHWNSQGYLVHHAATDSWTEQSLTWNTQPAFDLVALDTLAPFLDDKLWKAWEVTAAVAQELADDGVLTLVVAGQTLFDPATGPDDAENWAYGKEHGDGTLGPRLRIHHTQ